MFRNVMFCMYVIMYVCVHACMHVCPFATYMEVNCGMPGFRTTATRLPSPRLFFLASSIVRILDCQDSRIARSIPVHSKLISPMVCHR